MKAEDKTLFKFLKNLNGQLTIPIYQRNYSWNEKQYKRLWDDLIQINYKNKKSEHFLGTIVSKSQENDNEIDLYEITLIDGQQRITCYTLLCAAICAFCKNNDIKDFKWENKIYNAILVNLIGDGDKRYRLSLQKADDQTLKMIINDLPEPLNLNSEISTKIAKTYNFFYQQLTLDNFLDIFNKSTRFKIFDGQAEVHDDAQIIFDSLNTSGAPLKSYEQIRNYTLMDYNTNIQKELYYTYWVKFMKYFKNRTVQFDQFMSSFKRYRLEQLSKGGNEYDYIKKVVNNGTSKEEILKELDVFFDKYITIQKCETGIKEVDEILEFILKVCGIEVYPIILKIYDAYLKELCSEKEFIACIKLLDTYICRHKVMEDGLGKMLRNSFNNLNQIKEEDCYYSLKILSENYEINDEQFKNGLENFKPNKIKNFTEIFLKRIENNFHNNNPISIKKYNIEHIMPKNLNKKWKAKLGFNYYNIHYKYCENLGNLTLVTYSPQKSDNTFEEKLNMKNGFKDSDLWLNKSICDYIYWNEDTIIKRLNFLTKICLKIWPTPKKDF